MKQLELFKNGYITLEEKHLYGNIINCYYLKYQDEQHYNQCCLDEEHETALYFKVAILVDDFTKWIEGNEMNVFYEDGFDPFTNYGHTQIKRTLDFDEYCVESNLRKYIYSGAAANIKLIDE